jgi:Mg2+-importing ATPase
MSAGPIASSHPFWSEDAKALMRRLGARRTGLTSAEAEARVRRDGPNAIDDADRMSVAKLVWRQFESPLVLILVFGSTVALFLREWSEAAIILAIVLASTALGFFQEHKATRAIEALRRRLTLSARVLRDGAAVEMPFARIVAGDIVLLSAGALVPADGLVLDATDFLVAEASLTGESFPVEKKPGVFPPETPLAERRNCAFAGASVRSGEARMLVCATGGRTVLGHIAARLHRREAETEFGRGLRRFGYLLLRMAILLVVFVLVVNQILGRPFLESLLFSVALAVGLSPELLPAIVSVTLSAGARSLAKGGVLVRRLEAIENLGAIDILCTDKTGTLTEGTIALSGALGPGGEPSTEVMRLAFANAALETGIENPLDQAIVSSGQGQGLTTGAWRKVDEIPYDFARKRLTVVVEDADDPAGERLLITKGAFDQVMAACVWVARAGGADRLDAQAREALAERFADFGTKGLRVLGLATRRVSAKADYVREDECEMTFVGFLTFAAPLKTDARQTVEDLRARGVKVKIVTGDNRHAAAYVAQALGIDPSALLSGRQVDEIKGDALLPLVERTHVFAEIEPQQKERIVKALQRNGHAVGFLGDGINDGPALFAADVGVSVDQAVDVAREAADVILLERDLRILMNGIESGRRAFANTLKYICITTGASFGNMVSMALATPLLPFLPMTPTQVLLTNFLTDMPLMAVAGDNVDCEQREAPQRWRVRDVQSFMLVFGLLSSAFDLGTFWLLRAFFHAGEIVFQTTWFTVSVLTELAAILVLRTRRSVFKSRPGAWLVGLAAAIAAAVFAAPGLAEMGDALGLHPLASPVLMASVAIVLAYAAATEGVKSAFFRRQARVHALRGPRNHRTRA